MPASASSGSSPRSSRRHPLSEEKPLLEIDSVDVCYGKRRTKRQILDAVSLQVRPGEIVGLIGESGSGKSTIARAVLGLVPVTSGRITVAGEQVTSFSRS